MLPEQSRNVVTSQGCCDIAGGGGGGGGGGNLVWDDAYRKGSVGQQALSSLSRPVILRHFCSSLCCATLTMILSLSLNHIHKHTQTSLSLLILVSVTFC